MPKVSIEHKNERRQEIIQACAELYKTMGFREITLKEISAVTSISRPSIYNYFKTKEEIFLGLLTQEYEIWTQDLLDVTNRNAHLTRTKLAHELARTLSKRENLLKISAMNLYEIEENSDLKCLEEYKIAYKKALDTVCTCVEKYIPEQAEEKKYLMQYGFFPFTYGAYPFANPTAKQMEAMAHTGVAFESITIYDITYTFLKQLLQ